MEEHQWNNRVIVLQADDQSKDLLEQQFEILNHNTKELVERKLVLYKCFQDSCLFYDGVNDAQLLPNLEIEEKGFQFILIGMDGGIKLRSQNIVTAKQLFALIDGMPMRRHEIKQKQRRND